MFFPKTPAQEQDSFDKLATYFLFTIATYLVSFPIIERLVGSPSTNIYLSALLASLIAVLLGGALAFGNIFYQSKGVFETLRKYLRNYIPQKGSLWNQAFQSDRRMLEGVKNRELIVKVAVVMKNDKKVYYGELYSYPTEDNITDTKDFIIQGVTLFRNVKNGVRETKYSPNVKLIINQRDVEAIMYNYEEQE